MEVVDVVNVVTVARTEGTGEEVVFPLRPSGVIFLLPA